MYPLKNLTSNNRISKEAIYACVAFVIALFVIVLDWIMFVNPPPLFLDRIDTSYRLLLLTKGYTLYNFVIDALYALPPIATVSAIVASIFFGVVSVVKTEKHPAKGRMLAIIIVTLAIPLCIAIFTVMGAFFIES